MSPRIALTASRRGRNEDVKKKKERELLNEDAILNRSRKGPPLALTRVNVDSASGYISPVCLDPRLSASTAIIVPVLSSPLYRSVVTALYAAIR